MTFYSIYRFIIEIGAFMYPIQLIACFLWIPVIIGTFARLIYLKKTANKKIGIYCSIVLIPFIVDLALCFIPGLSNLEEYVFVIVTLVYLCVPAFLLIIQFFNKKKIDIKMILFFILSWFFFYCTHYTVQYFASV